MEYVAEIDTTTDQPWWLIYIKILEGLNIIVFFLRLLDPLSSLSDYMSLYSKSEWEEKYASK